jgi:paraquat-inducible protein B
MAINRPAVVGAFVLGGLALIVGGIVFFGGMQIFYPTAHAVVFFEGSVAGLDVGAPVTFRGARVGSVQAVRIEVTRKGQAVIPVYIEFLPGRVTAREEGGRPVEPDLAQAVAVGLRAQLQMQSLITGQLRVNLDFLPDTHGYVAPVDTGGITQIPTVRSDVERVQQALAELPEVMESARHALDAIDRLATHLDDEIGPIATEAKRSLDSFSRAMNALELAVTRLQTDASHTLGGIDDFTGDGRRQINDRGAELSRLLRTAEEAARQAEALIVSLNQLMSERAQFRSDLEATVRDLASTASSLRDFARQLEQNPGVLLRGRSER